MDNFLILKLAKGWRFLYYHHSLFPLYHRYCILSIVLIAKIGLVGNVILTIFMHIIKCPDVLVI